MAGSTNNPRILTKTEYTAKNLALFEDLRDIVTTGNTDRSLHFIKISTEKFKLRKKNNDRLVSDIQLDNQLKRKRKVSFFFKSRRIVTNITKPPRGSQICIIYKN